MEQSSSNKLTIEQLSQLKIAFTEIKNHIVHGIYYTHIPAKELRELLATMIADIKDAIEMT